MAEENKNKQGSTHKVEEDDDENFENLLDDCAKNLDTQLKITTPVVAPQQQQPTVQQPQSINNSSMNGEDEEGEDELPPNFKDI